MPTPSMSNWNDCWDTTSGIQGRERLPYWYWTMHNFCRISNNTSGVASISTDIFSSSTYTVILPFYQPHSPPPTHTITFLPSGVVSSNSLLSSKVVSDVVKVVSDFIDHLSPSTLMMTLGLATAPSFRIMNPTSAAANLQDTHVPKQRKKCICRLPANTALKYFS